MYNNCHLPSPDSDHGSICRHEQLLGNIPLLALILVVALILVDPLKLVDLWQTDVIGKLEHEGFARPKISLS